MIESNPLLIPVQPTLPVAPYLGGKRNLAGRIIPLLAAVQHTTYVEPFFGMGGIFLRRPWRSRSEVINDVSTDITNLFRILQRHFQPFMDTLKRLISSRAEFERLVAAVPDTLTDLERAARFDITKLAAMLEDVHERLAGVVIERLPYHELISRYDRAETLFYLDPPYWGCEDDYGRQVFAREDFTRLADQLAALRGRFIMSLNDRIEVRALFQNFHQAEVSTTYSISSKATARTGFSELLISNMPVTLNPP